MASYESPFFYIQFNDEKILLPNSMLHKLPNIVNSVRTQDRCYHVSSHVDAAAFHIFLARLLKQRSEVGNELKDDVQRLCDEFGYRGFDADLGRTFSSGSVSTVSSKVMESLTLAQERLDVLEEEWEGGRSEQRRSIAARDDQIRELKEENSNLKRELEGLKKEMEQVKKDQRRFDALRTWQRVSSWENWTLSDDVVETIHEGAEKKDCDCQWVYAECLSRSRSEEKQKEAVNYYKLAAEQGHREAQWRYAECCKENPEEAAKHYRMAAEKGHCESQWKYGQCLENGTGVKKNQTKCWEFYLSAARQGHVKAMCKYADHLVADTQFEEAAAMYKRAAKRHDPEAMVQYGRLLKEGKGVNYNEKKAVLYFKRAADMRLPEAMVEYGRCLRDGNGCKKDEKTALTYFKGAAGMGSQRGMVKCGKCLRDGCGCLPDREEAKRYFKDSQTAKGRAYLKRMEEEDGELGW